MLNLAFISWMIWCTRPSCHPFIVGYLESWISFASKQKPKMQLPRPARSKTLTNLTTGSTVSLTVCVCWYASSASERICLSFEYPTCQTAIENIWPFKVTFATADTLTVQENGMHNVISIGRTMMDPPQADTDHFIDCCWSHQVWREKWSERK